MEASELFQGVDKMSTAYKLLSRMGWQEGQGLGVSKQGIVQHVKVKKNAENSGVGLAQENARARDWTLGMVAYDKVLAALRPVALDLLPPTELNAQSQKSKKRKRGKETSSNNAQLDSKGSNSIQKKLELHKGGMETKQKEAADQSTVHKVSLGEKKVATHVGRFQKRTKNKLVKGYSATDLAAILGEKTIEKDGSSEPNKHARETSQHAPDHTLRISFTDSANDTSAIQLERCPVPTISPAEESLEASEASDATQADRSWWSGYFVQAGGVGGSRAYAAFATDTEKRKVNIDGFSEQDQANLWQNVTDAQTKSRQGLGQSSELKKVAGTRWKGTRLQITDSDDQAKAQAIHPQNVTAVLEPPSSEPPMKWKKLAKNVLSKSDGQKMRRKDLLNQAWTIANAKGFSNKEIFDSSMLEALHGSKQFEVGKKYIVAL